MRKVIVSQVSITFEPRDMDSLKYICELAEASLMTQPNSEKRKGAESLIKDVLTTLARVKRIPAAAMVSSMPELEAEEKPNDEKF